MELIVFIGIQAVGKSSFFRDRFFATHVRVNLDMLRTRHREELLMDACFKGKTSFVVDNTNLQRKDRQRYIQPAKAAGFRICGYFFQSRAADAIRRNGERDEKSRVPDVAIRGSASRLEFPDYSEGFDQLHFVRINEINQFEIEEWKNEV